MESVDARIYELEPSYAAQEPPPCRLSKEDLSKTPLARFGAEIAKHNALMISRSQNIADCE